MISSSNLTPSTDILASSILFTTPIAAATAFDSAIPSTLPILSLLENSAQTEILGNVQNLDDALALLSATSSRISETLASAKNSDFEPIFDSPFAALSTVALVTASDMVPFVPCQPLAISLGARYGAGAFPLCVVGQTLAGCLAFQSSRKVSDAEQVQKVLESLGDDGRVQFQKFKTESLLGGSESGGSDERTVFLAMVGLRLAPFFPFSAGNYLLGGATDVGLRPFVLATILGCTFSNAVSVLVGMGGAELFLTATTNTT
jgi:uncharacterized membrane protein YdjX (TVP38/TMEM64 family)